MGDEEELSLKDIAKMLSVVNDKIDTNKAELGKSINDHAANIEITLKRSIDKVVGPVSKRVEELEAKSDERFKLLEKTVANLSELISVNNDQNPKQSSSATTGYNVPVHTAPTSQPGILPVQPSQSSPAIMELIAEARTIMGIGPVESSDFEYFGQPNPDDNIRLAAIEALRDELNIKENEIKDSDIASTFLPPFSPKIPRVYIKFFKQEHADLCFRAAKGLKDPKIKVFRYFPRQFQARVRALEEVAYPMRKSSNPKYKTEVVYTATDVQLLICPKGQSRYYPHPVPDLPPIDMAPARSPPPGRQRHCKRNRSDDTSPQINKKNSRQESPLPSDKDQLLSPLSDSRPPVINIPQDLGSYSSMEVISPLTGKVSFDFKQPVNLRRQSLNM